jgi:hydrogenase maturation protease
VAWQIIGCGTELRGDDEAGLLVARQLKQLGLNAREHTSDSLSLIESWRPEESIILVDAIYSGRPPGEIVMFDDGWPSTAVAGAWRCSTHMIGIAQAVELARLLGRMPARLVLYGIEGRQFKMGTPPSSEVSEACRQLANRIAREA